MVEATTEKQYSGHDQAVVREWKVAETYLAGEAKGGVARILRESRRSLDIREGNTRSSHGVDVQSETEKTQGRSK